MPVRGCTGQTRIQRAGTRKRNCGHCLLLRMAAAYQPAPRVGLTNARSWKVYAPFLVQAPWVVPAPQLEAIGCWYDAAVPRGAPFDEDNNQGPFAKLHGALT